MDHREYIERYISSDCAVEPNPKERMAISEHLASCPECAEQLARERAIKSILQTKVPIVPAPDSLRMKIAAALDNEDASERARRASVFRPAIWTTAAVMAAAAILLVVILRVRQTSVPAFDEAITSYRQSERNFTPAIGTNSNEGLAVALINEFGVAPVWDFSSLGLSPVGGRIAHAADGKATAYSMYQGQRGSLLCIIDRNDNFHFPSRGQVVKGIHIYRYDGYSIAVTNRYSVFCIMVTRLPVTDLARAFNRLPV
jgi:anti-sigma factor RsiW